MSEFFEYVVQAIVEFVLPPYGKRKKKQDESEDQ